MEEADPRPHSGIPLSHKVFAVVLAAVVAAAGCFALIYRARRSATAVLAFNPAAAQSIDPGVASARYPAIALADAALNDKTVAQLTAQAHLASSTPGNQVGEFRSELRLTQPRAGRLDVRFGAADATQSLAMANVAARALAGWNPAVGNPPAAPTQSAAGHLLTRQSPGAEDHGQSRPQAAEPAPVPDLKTSRGVPDHPSPDQSLSGALGKIGLELAATNQQLERLDTGEAQSSGGEQSAHIESREQALLRSEVTEAQKTLGSLRTRYAKDLADPKIGAPMDAIRAAVDSISPGGHRNGFNAAGFSTSELSSERSALRRAVGVVDQETKKVRLAESAHITDETNPPSAATVAVAGTSKEPSVPETSSAPAQPAASSMREQNVESGAPAGQPPKQLSQNSFSIVRLAAPAPRPKFWAAIAAGVLCGLLYFGIVAFAYRRRPGADAYRQMNAATHRLITFPEPVRVNEPADARAETAESKVDSGQGTALVDEASVQEGAPAPTENVTPIDETAAPATSEATPVGDAVISSEAVSVVAQPLESDNDLSRAGAEPVANADSAAGIAPASAEEAPAPEAISEGKSDAPPNSRKDPPAERRSHIWSTESIAGGDPVAERLRKSLADTAIARMFEGPARAAADNSDPGQHTEAEIRDPLSDSVSDSGE